MIVRVRVFVFVFVFVVFVVFVVCVGERGGEIGGGGGWMGGCCVCRSLDSVKGANLTPGSLRSLPQDN